MRKDYSAIVRLHRQGLSKNAIAMSLGCRWETVGDALEKCTRSSIAVRINEKAKRLLLQGPDLRSLEMR